MNTKCRFHHGIKTFTTFLDDQTVTHGITKQTITTPEGVTVTGPAFTGDDLFPGLSDIQFTQPANAPPAENREPDTNTDEPTRRRPRLADKHARRRTERHHNRTTAGADDPPPF